MRTAQSRLVLEKKYCGTHHASENHISPDPINFLTNVEIWDILMRMLTGLHASPLRSFRSAVLV